MLTRFNLNRLAYFVATIEAGTITGAASALGISKAVVSKQLQLLEYEVDTPLLLRNTRKLQPTEAGLAFYENAKSALTQATNAYEEVLERDKRPKGKLRVTCPVDYGVSHVAPFTARFQEIYPDVEIELIMSDHTVDLIEERFDLSFRIGWLRDSANLARRIDRFQEVVVCSPQTQERANIKEPSDLKNVPFVKGYALGPIREWTFKKADTESTVTLQAATQMNITLAIRAFVQNGFGFTILPDFMLRTELEMGRLVQVLPDWSLRDGGVYTVTPPGRVRSNALTRYLELAHSELGLRT